MHLEGSDLLSHGRADVGGRVKTVFTCVYRLGAH